MTPFGHITSAYVLGKTNKKLDVFAVILGTLLPDLDFLFIFFPFFNHIHRVFTHNVFFVLLSGIISIIIIEFVYKEKNTNNNAFLDKKNSLILGVFKNKNASIFCLSLILGGFLHLFIDSCWDSNPSNGIGLALFWPLSYRFYSPFNLLSSNISSPGWDQPLLMLKSVLPYLVYEIPLGILAFILFLFFEKK